MDKKSIDKYIKFFYAASNYYGAVELDEFIDAYFTENDFDDLYELFFTCYEHKLIKAYKIKDKYYLTSYDKKGLKECLSLQGNKKLHIINKKELIKYADKNYYPKNELSDYMKKYGANEEIILDVMDYMVSIYFDYSDIFKCLAENLEDIESLEELANTLKKTYNNMPIHANKGYSPNELNSQTNPNYS